MTDTVDMGSIGPLPSVQSVQERINSRYDNLFHYNKDGSRAVFACSFCDQILISERDRYCISIDKLAKCRHLFQWSKKLSDNERIPEVESYYRLEDKNSCLRDKKLLHGLALSPRGVITRKSTRGKWNLSSCSTCSTAIENKYTPFYAIVNKNYVGCPPPCLSELTEVEMSFITPVNGYGWCLSYAGGAQKNLKGTLTFMRISERKIARAAIHVEQMGITNHVVVLISGKMTKAQQERARKRGSQIRTNKILDAVEWLVENHVRWQSVDLDKYREELEGIQPVVIDNSSEVDSENINVESRELFTCYFPDATTTERTGGFDDTNTFKEYVDRMKRDNYDVELQIDLNAEYFRDQDGDLLLDACLLQFPRGIGGMYEPRELKDGSFKDRVDTEKFLTHLASLSNPIFQTPMFQLISFSLISKSRILKKSRLQLKTKKNAATLVGGLTAEDMSRTIRSRRNGDRTTGSAASKQLLNAVDAVSRSLPHTDDASKIARSNGEMMLHHLGQASIWFTVSFDDENSFLMQILTQKEVDDGSPIDELSDEELSRRAKERRAIRINFPGMASIHFEMLLQIVIEEVVGWDLRKNCATDNPGLFGECYALCMAIEEQGRKTLHVHLQAWIRYLRKLQQALFFGHLHEKRIAEGVLKKYLDHIATTELFPTQTSADRYAIVKMMEHECVVGNIRDRQEPNEPSLQHLRVMRHRKGYKAVEGIFSTCPLCQKTWTYEEMIMCLLRQSAEIEIPEEQQINSDDDDIEPEGAQTNIMVLPRPRMLAEIIDFQRQKEASVEDTPVTCINVCTNHHFSYHAKGSCFRCMKTGKKSKHTCGPKCECRMRLPMPQNKASKIHTQHEGLVWYTWRGTEKLQPIVEFIPRRGRYDSFQNVSCKAVSESKIASNSNVAIISDGPTGAYMFKYLLKKTQQQDQAEYAEVDRSIKAMNGRVHEDDNREAARLICRAAFAHNTANILGPSMAHYLTRHGTRFYFSHTGVFCPLRDLISIMNRENVSVTANYDTCGNVFFENQALHYLCRPHELEDLSLQQFCEGFCVITMPKSTPTHSKKRKRDSVEDDPGDEPLRFVSDTGYYQHPSARLLPNGELSEARQGVKQRQEDVYIKISQWMFPDTSKFGGDILTCPTDEITVDMERYSQLVLTLFLPFRRKQDLQSTVVLQSGLMRPYTMKLREIYEEEIYQQHYHETRPRVFSDSRQAFLQNIQNAAYNSLRYKLGEDDLQRHTEPFQPDQDMGDVELEHDEDEEDDDDNEGIPYETIMQHLGEEVDITDDNDSFLPASLQGFSFTAIRNKGLRRSGYNDDLPIPVHCDFADDGTEKPDFVHYNVEINPTTTTQGTDGATKRQHTLKDIVNLLLTRTEARSKDNVFKNNPEAKVSNANGSVASIVEWAKAAKLDGVQRRAFECIISSFILTFYDDDDMDLEQDDATVSAKDRAKFRRSRRDLLRLKGSKKSQLICLLHGPGGSGKSTVINLVHAYAREYCLEMGYPYTSRTIVITAMSGVAATLLHGETAHSALCLNRRSISETEQEAWEQTRLVIIDEVSFASETDFEKIFINLRILKRQLFKFFGGLSIVFAGDFSQLEPPRRDPIYVQHSPYFHDLLNCFIELDGMHRFRDDPAWGYRLFRFREGEATLDDVDVINENCLISEEHKPSSGVQVACYRNKDRDAVNCAIFEEYCRKNKPEDGSLFKGAVVILMDGLLMHSGTRTYVPIKSNAMKRHFWMFCGEDSCRFESKHSGRVDPMLKLYPGCPMMLTQNKDVPNGQANGSRVHMMQINVKVGEQPFHLRLDCGTVIRAFLASQVRSLLIEHEADDIYPRQFESKVESFTFSATMDIEDDTLVTKMKGNQFPLISNSATTGHKLQGYTAIELLANSWHYGQNWVYVVLSRVRTMAGLYIREKLSTDLSKYAMPQAMKNMLKDFRRRIMLPSIDDDVYEDMINQEIRDIDENT